MNKQKILIYDFIELFHIFDELKNELNLELIEIKKNKLLKNSLFNIEDYLVISKEMIPGINNLFLVNSFPTKMVKLVERLNISFLRLRFHQQSEIKIGNYLINLNSRELTSFNNKLKLTEKEANTIIYLLKFNKPIPVSELQAKVWGYQSELETHTVETHIYRLRKKILKTFNDSRFITSKKNGYQIN